MRDEITVTIQDSEGRTYTKDWKNTEDKRNAIRWTLANVYLPNYIDIAKIESVTVKPSIFTQE